MLRSIYSVPSAADFATSGTPPMFLDVMRRFIPLIAALLLLALPGTAPATEEGPTAYAAQASLLLERVESLSWSVSSGQFPVATGHDGTVHFVPGSDWTSGFWSGTLWRTYDLTGGVRERQRAIAATVDHFGSERTKLHDLGFMYGESSVAGYRRLCGETPVEGTPCASFRRSGLRAARTLLELSRTTGQGIIPMSARDCSDCPRGETETIIDSMMNLPLLYWATSTSGNRSYRNLARRHASWVARHLFRPDGSTFQAGRYQRSSKRPQVRRHTHQGLNNRSVWARGQAWSIYGFADAGVAFRSKPYLEVAEKNAEYLAQRLPEGGVPPWDFRAGKDAPPDVSAGVIAAAGLLHLANACKRVSNGCASAGRWAPLARRILTGSLTHLQSTPTTGYLGGMVYRMRGRKSWERDAELVFGLNYALEAIRLTRK